MAPLFPRSGPGESSSPMSQVLLASRSAYPVAYLFRFRAPRDPPCFVSRNLRSRKARGTFLARSLFTRRPNQPVCSHVDVNGISQVPRRSVPCLCLALRPRPNRQSLATHTVSSLLPPRFPRRRLQRLMNFGAQSRGFSTRCLRFKTGVATTPARLASGWLARLYRVRESNPQDRYKRFQIAVSSSFSGFILAQGKFHGIALRNTGSEATHSALMLAALMTGHHFSISAF